MSNLNTVALIGRLGADPEARYFESGSQVTSFSLAVSGWSKDDSDAVTHWIDVKVWGKLAQVCCDYLRKGHLCAIAGRLEQERWTTTAGEKRSKLVVVANSMQMLTKKEEAAAQEQGLDDDEMPF